MKLLSINKKLTIKNIDITNLEYDDIDAIESLDEFDYIIISGGDGALRRAIKKLHFKFYKISPKVIINPAGTFNVLYHKLNSLKLSKIVHKLSKNEPTKTKSLDYFMINRSEIFIFSAGNSLDVLYVVLSELFRISFLSRSKIRYLLSFLFLLPVIIAALPLFLFSKNYYFVFLFAKLKISKIFNINFFVNNEIVVDLKQSNNLMQLDGDLIIIKDRYIKIERAGEILVVVG